MRRPDYIFEASWEVCNKVGGIYTVLATRAKTMTQYVGKNNAIFLGPYFEEEEYPNDFQPTTELYVFKEYLLANFDIKIQVGRWQVPGNPVAILVDFRKFYCQKNQIYAEFWEKFSVDSLHAYGDYDESSMFGYAVGVVIKEFTKFYDIENKTIVAHFNEWMTSFGLFYMKAFCPKICTVFTTHATTIGRSIAGNGKPLYEYLQIYDGDQMARELNVEAKHSAEKQAAINADCFTTVSQITAEECEALLNKKPDIITPNGFELNFVPSEEQYKTKRLKAKELLRRLAENTLGYKLSTNTLFIGISGRYEYKNKGIDVFIDIASKLREYSDLPQEVVAFIIVPAWVKKGCYSNSKFATTALVEEERDLALNYIKQKGFDNEQKSNTKIIFIPTYLNGNDGALNVPYYDILIGLDLTVFPSYYEPWGYTPMESAAFGIPTFTTSLSGFGRWIIGKNESCPIEKGVGVVHRTESNYFEVVEAITSSIVDFSKKTKLKKEHIYLRARKISHKALWEHFFKHYEKAYRIAMRKKLQL